MSVEPDVERLEELGAMKMEFSLKCQRCGRHTKDSFDPLFPKDGFVCKCGAIHAIEIEESGGDEGPTFSAHTHLAPKQKESDLWPTGEIPQGRPRPKYRPIGEKEKSVHRAAEMHVLDRIASALERIAGALEEDPLRLEGVKGSPGAHIDFEATRCPTCHGSGEHEGLPCPHCDGKGWV